MRFNPRPPKRTLCPRRPQTRRYKFHVSIHVLRRGRCVTIVLDQWSELIFIVSIHVLRRGRCVAVIFICLGIYAKFQSTSSEEDVVSVSFCRLSAVLKSFNPRPPKRTLCHFVSIHCTVGVLCFNPRPPKRTLCPLSSCPIQTLHKVSIHVLRRGRCVPGSDTIYSIMLPRFNPRPPKRTLCRVWKIQLSLAPYSFNPRPPKRTLCPAALEDL